MSGCPHISWLHTMPHTHTHSHTIWGPQTDRAKNGYCQFFSSSFQWKPPPPLPSKLQLGLDSPVWIALRVERAHVVDLLQVDVGEDQLVVGGVDDGGAVGAGEDVSGGHGAEGAQHCGLRAQRHLLLVAEVPCKPSEWSLSQLSAKLKQSWRGGWVGWGWVGGWVGGGGEVLWYVWPGPFSSPLLKNAQKSDWDPNQPTTPPPSSWKPRWRAVHCNHKF